MYEDLIQDVDWDEDDVFEQFLKGILENMDEMNKELHDIRNDINDIQDAIGKGIM